MSSSPEPRCLVRGSLNIDEIFHLPHIVRPGETLSSTGLSKKAGGKGSNQAYAVARAGGKVDLDGTVGEDGLRLKELLAEGGVGVERVLVVTTEVTGRAVIQSAADGENSIGSTPTPYITVISMWAMTTQTPKPFRPLCKGEGRLLTFPLVLHKGANYYLPPTPSPPNLSPYTHLLLQNEIPLASTLTHLSSSSRLTSIFNPSPMLSPSELRDFPWSSLSWLIVNEGELSDLLRAFDALPHPAISPPAFHSIAGADIRDRAREEVLALHRCARFAETVSIICTLGAEGILYFRPLASGQLEMGHLAASRLENPIMDTTGAGDCFAGYFVAGLMREGKEGGITQVLRTCLTACAMCVEKAGALESIPAIVDVEARRQRQEA